MINEIDSEHDKILGVIARRGKSMQTIIDYWQSRGVSSALNAMHMMNEPCVTMDVLSNTFAKNSRIEMLNYGHVAMLLPHA